MHTETSTQTPEIYTRKLKSQEFISLPLQVFGNKQTSWQQQTETNETTRALTLNKGGRRQEEVYS